MQQILKLISTGVWYQDVLLYTIIAALIYVNVVLIKNSKKSRATAVEQEALAD